MATHNFYCRTEIFSTYYQIYCSYTRNNKIDEYLNISHKKERCLNIQGDENYTDVIDYDVYSIEHKNSQSVIAYLIKLEDFWQDSFHQHPSIISSDDSGICLSLLIYNRWGQSFDLLLHQNRWIIRGVSIHTKEYEENQIKCANTPWEHHKLFISYDPQYTEYPEYELISRETAISLIIEILDKNDFSKYVSTYEPMIEKTVISPHEIPF